MKKIKVISRKGLIILLSVFLLLPFFSYAQEAYLADMPDCGKNFSVSYKFVTGEAHKKTLSVNDQFDTNLTVTATGNDYIKDGQKVDIALVMDESGSMSGGKITDAKDALKDAINTLIDAEDEDSNQDNRVAVFSFDNIADKIVGFTNDFISAKQLIDDISAGGSTTIGGGLKAAGTHINNKGRDDAKKIIILASDGKHNTAPSISGDEGGAEYVPSDTTVYAIGIGSGADTNQLEEVTDSGNGKGTVYDDTSSDQLSSVIERIIEEEIIKFLAENVEFSIILNNIGNKYQLVSAEGAPAQTPLKNHRLKLTWRIEEPMKKDDSESFKITLKAIKPGKDVKINDRFMPISYDLETNEGDSCVTNIDIGKKLADILGECPSPRPDHLVVCSGDTKQIYDAIPSWSYVEKEEKCTGLQKCEFYCKNACYEYDSNNNNCKLIEDEATCEDLGNNAKCSQIQNIDEDDLCENGDYVSGSKNISANKITWKCESICAQNERNCSSKLECEWREVVP